MSSGKASSSSGGPFEAPVFAAVIRPHRSLGANGLRIVMTLFCLATIGASLPFIVAGFWPVGGFFGLDLVALYLAFRINNRRAADFGLQKLALVSRGERLVIAGDLSPPERESFAEALGQALADVKRGF